MNNTTKAAMQAAMEFWIENELWEPPTVVGWYPVMVCYDDCEGSFPTAAYWRVEGWSGWVSKGIYLIGNKRCETQREALDLAYENDYE